MPALTVGDPAPWFIPDSIANLDAHENTMIGGYRAVLFFFGSASNPVVNRVLMEFLAAQTQFEQSHVTFFGVGIDPNDIHLEQHSQNSAQIKFLWDVKGDLSIAYGVCQLDQSGGMAYDPTTFVLDENLRILEIMPLETHIAHCDRLLKFIRQLPVPLPARLITRQQAPVLIIPGVLSPEVCRQLIGLYEADGGAVSGFMQQEKDGTTSIALNPQVKRRRDLLLTDAALLHQMNELVWRRVVPNVQKAFQFRITQVERYTIGCYEATEQGFFQPHRDNTSLGSAHRRFAMTINLNSGDYEGGCLRFSEYGPDLYAPETGSAILFSCSLLHEVTPVTEGRRFALLSFFFDDEGAKLRQQTLHQIVRNPPAQSPQPTAGDRPPRSEKPALGFQTKRKK